MASALFIIQCVLNFLFILSHMTFDGIFVGSVLARKLDNSFTVSLISEQNTPADGQMFQPTTSEVNTSEFGGTSNSTVRKDKDKLNFECSHLNTNTTTVHCERLNNDNSSMASVLPWNKIGKTVERFNMSVSNKLYGCYHGKFVYHNITIATNELPPLLRPAPREIIMKRFDHLFKDAFTGTIVFEIKDFLLIRHIDYENNLCRTEVLLTLVIFSSTFNEILNPANIQYPYQTETSVFEIASLCNFQDACFPKSQAIPVCYCDNICTVYDDCCLDYRAHDKNSPEVELHTLKKPFMSCLENEYISPNNFAGYWLVSECSNDQELFEKLNQDQYSVLKERCEVAFDDAFFVPVVSTKTQIHYRNAYCALCHNEDIYVHWSQERPFKLESFGKHNSPKVTSVQPPREYEARVCYNFTFTDCPARAEESQYSKTLKKICRSHQNPMIFMYTLNQTSFPNFTKVVSIHRNTYCFICNTHFISMRERLCLAEVSYQQYDFSSYGWLFRTDHLLYLPSGYKGCRNGEAWQSFLNKCVKIACPQFQTPYAGGCEDITSTSQTGNLTFPFYINGNLTDEIYSFFIGRFVTKVTAEFPGVLVIYVKPLSQAIKDRLVVLIVQARFQGILSASDLSKPSVLKHWTYIYSTNIKTDLVYIPTFIIYNQRGGGKNFLSEMQILSKSILEDWTGHFMNTSVLCFPYSVEKVESRRRKNEKIETCAPSSHLKSLTNIDYIRSLTVPIEEVISTYLSMGSSSMALLVMLYRFKRIKSLSSIKQILFHCMLVKLLSQVTFMIGCGANDVKLVCYIIGVVLHYLWLSAFVWSSVCAYFFYYVFVVALRNIKNAILTHSSSIKPFIVIGYTLPLLFVFVSVSIDFMKNDGEWSYGERICFITGRETLLFGFAFPTCFMVYLNFIFFFTTILHMGNGNLFITSWRKKINRYYSICVKMSVLLSLTWGLGFFASWLNSQTFWILFIWMDGLQGCLLCATFLPYKCSSRLPKRISTN